MEMRGESREGLSKTKRSRQAVDAVPVQILGLTLILLTGLPYPWQLSEPRKVTERDTR